MTGENQDGFDPRPVFEVDDYLYFYRDALTDERSEAEVRALVSLLALDKPMQILDLACGYGRHTNRLAALGHTLTGIDLMPGFLDMARQDAQQRKVDVVYRQGDMRHIDFHQEFDRVLLLFTAFGYFSDEGNLQVLVNVQKALKPGGLLVFDMNTAYAFSTVWNNATYFSDSPDLSTAFVSEYDACHQRTSVVVTCFRRQGDGYQKLQERHVEQAYPPEQVATLLRDAGLTVEAAYQCFGFQPYDDESSRILWVARNGRGSR